MRTIAELCDVDDPAWPVVEQAIAAAELPVTILPVDPARGETTLLQLQVSARSFMGALALHTGGVLIDSGWLRMMGGGDPPLNLAIANGLEELPDEPLGQNVVAFDVLGGTYAINGGALPGPSGEVCYFAPDTLDWMALGMSFSAFVMWSVTANFAMFNEHLRWPGWPDEVAALRLDEAINTYPPPFTVEGQDLSKASRRPVPLGEQLSFLQDAAVQLRHVEPGQQYHENVVDDADGGS